eukprot:CAMPEP_0175146854 /NCGR_PEP_ID=MMETSP0087-20121206/15628_1 /TAXON_ID=136419 /ORGANISM="Unknown Unknown, Strain D1" /LENGTH=303 /DNA_ID=CAMNT_0016431899 /DNA_START=121 /DNA_END=1032 /DNA_ORIENTATION=+
MKWPVEIAKNEPITDIFVFEIPMSVWNDAKGLTKRTRFKLKIHAKKGAAGTLKMKVGYGKRPTEDDDVLGSKGTCVKGDCETAFVLESEYVRPRLKYYVSLQAECSFTSCWKTVDVWEFGWFLLSDDEFATPVPIRHQNECPSITFRGGPQAFVRPFFIVSIAPNMAGQSTGSDLYLAFSSKNTGNGVMGYKSGRVAVLFLLNPRSPLGELSLPETEDDVTDRMFAFPAPGADAIEGDWLSGALPVGPGEWWVAPYAHSETKYSFAIGVNKEVYNGGSTLMPSFWTFLCLFVTLMCSAALTAV